jgi:hypothetical protein
VVPIVIILIAVGGWVGYRHRPLPVSHPAIPKVIPANLQLPLPPRIDKPPKTRKAGKHNAQKPAFKRKRIGQNEIDYVMDDVTIRQFGPISPAKEPRGLNK